MKRRVEEDTYKSATAPRTRTVRFSMNKPHKHEKIILKLLSEDDRIEYCLTEGRIAADFFINEAVKEVSENDVKNVAKSVEKTQKEIQIILKACDESGLVLFTDYFSANLAALKSINKMVASVSITGVAKNPSIAQSILSFGIGVEDSVSKTSIALQKAMSKFSEELTPLIGDENKSKSLSKIAGDEGADEKDIPPEEELKQGIQTTLSDSGYGKQEEKQASLFSKMMSAIKTGWTALKKKMPGGNDKSVQDAQKVAKKIAELKASIDSKSVPTPDAVADAMMGLSIDQINKFSDSIKKSKIQPPPKTSLQALQAKLKVTPAPEPKPAPPTGEPSPGKPAPKKGQVKLSDISSELERQLKDLGLNDLPAVMKALTTNDKTKTIFAESRGRTWGRESTSRPIHRQQLTSLLFEADPAPTSGDSDEEKPVAPISYSDVEAAIKETAKEKSDVAAAKIILFLKGKQASVDDGSIPVDVKTKALEAGKDKKSSIKKMNLKTLNSIGVNMRKSQYGNLKNQINAKAKEAGASDDIMESNTSVDRDQILSERWSRLAGIKDEN